MFFARAKGLAELRKKVESLSDMVKLLNTRSAYLETAVNTLEAEKSALERQNDKLRAELETLRTGLAVHFDQFGSPAKPPKTTYSVNRVVEALLAYLELGIASGQEDVKLEYQEQIAKPQRTKSAPTNNRASDPAPQPARVATSHRSEQLDSMGRKIGNRASGMRKTDKKNEASGDNLKVWVD